MTSTRSNWSREQIRNARAAELPPLLQRYGLRLHPTGADNFHVERYAGLIVKRSFWRWPERNMQGNAIDLFVNVLGMSFNEAMRQIVAEDNTGHFTE